MPQARRQTNLRQAWEVGATPGPMLQSREQGGDSQTEGGGRGRTCSVGPGKDRGGSVGAQLAPLISFWPSKPPGPCVRASPSHTRAPRKLSWRSISESCPTELAQGQGSRGAAQPEAWVTAMLPMS